MKYEIRLRSDVVRLWQSVAFFALAPMIFFRPHPYTLNELTLGALKVFAALFIHTLVSTSEHELLWLALWHTTSDGAFGEYVCF